MQPKTKSYIFKDFTSQPTGEFKAIFATMNVLDKDGDITMPGAFGNQQVIIGAYNHKSWQDKLPCGKGKIYEEDNNAIVEGKFFMDTESGKETYLTVKNVGALQEWSYSLPAIDFEYKQQENGQRVRVLKKITVNEVAPVLMGAGEGTQTVDMKTAFGSHSTKTDDGKWDAGAQKKNVKSGEARSYYAKIYAWYDPSGDDGVKSSYKFIHHFVDSDGTPGAASTVACSAGIAILNGGRGGTKIPDADRKGVYNHLAKHIKDAGKEPPELKSFDSEGTRLKLADHLEVLLADIEEAAERVEDLGELRDTEGRHPSQATLKRIAVIKTGLDDLSRRLGAVEEKHNAVYSEFLRFQKLITGRAN